MAHDEHRVRGYIRMLERLREAGADGMHTLQQRLDRAREAAVHLGELTREEADLVGNYVRRDLNQIGRFLDRGSHAFAEWLDFDLDMLESDAWKWLGRLADPTELAWLQLAAPEPTTDEYHTGEICGIGTLACRSCDQRLHFTRPGPIPPCPRCHKTLFSRLKE